MKNRVIYLVFSGVFAIFSIIFDQVSYQIENKIIQKEESNSLTYDNYIFGNRTNWMGANASKTFNMTVATDLPLMMDFLNEDEVLKEFNFMKSLIFEDMRDLSNMKLFSELQLENFKKRIEVLFANKSSYKSLPNDLNEMWIFANNDLVDLLEKGDSLARDSMTKMNKELLEINKYRYVRQIALIFSICSSLLSLLFLFIFIKNLLYVRN